MIPILGAPDEGPPSGVSVEYFVLGLGGLPERPTLRDGTGVICG